MTFHVENCWKKTEAWTHASVGIAGNGSNDLEE
jgi:hypothetical protein